MNSIDELKLCPFCGSEGMIAATLDDAFRPMCKNDRCCYLDGAATKADAIAAWNTRADPISSDDSELLTIAWMDGAHRSTKAHRDTIKALQAENERLREALEKIATVDMGGGFLGAQACQKVARTALEARNG